MIYTEFTGDLFEAPKDYYFVQCISADFAMGEGIALLFNKNFNTRRECRKLYPKYLYSNWKMFNKKHDCLKVGRVFNLITKELYYQKPIYQSLKGSLEDLKRIVDNQGITKLAMPRIGCGIDGLDWDKVQLLLKSTFDRSEVEIRVYSLK